MTNPFRNKIIQIVAVNPMFDRIILFVIMVNCFFLALDQEVDFVTQNNVEIDFVFLIIYTGEMILKIIAMGFFMRPHSYLRDGWNILDFTVVCLGWLSTFVNAGDISAIKVIRILRPLRTINQIPNMSSLVSTILNSLPIMMNVMVLFFFMLVMFGTIATQLLGGHLQNRCTEMLNGEPSIQLGYDEVEIICQTQQDCIDQQPAGVNSTCEYYGNPIAGTYSFDNILLSIMNIFQIITLEGWTDMMYIVRQAERSFAYDVFFLLCVIMGSFVILNLMIAVQSSYLDKAFDEEEETRRDHQAKLEHKKEQLKRGENQEESEDEEMEEQEGTESSSPSKKKTKTKGCCGGCKKPEFLVRW